MQLALVPISLVATPIYVLLATATCSCQVVMLPILSQVASHSLGVANINRTALKFSPAGCCP